jgi:hypothetical protein
VKPFVDRSALEQTSFDSATPSGTAVIVHRFVRPGRYALSLSPAGSKLTETRTLYVGDEPDADEPDTDRRGGDQPGRDRVKPPEPPRPDLHGSSPPPAIAVDLRLSADLVNAAAPPDLPDVAVLGEGGYASFTAPSGQASRVSVTRIGPAGEEDLEFDSARLGPTDVFALTLFRPGTYSVRNTLDGREGRLVVTYPQVGRVPYRPAPPATVSCREGGFEPAATTVGPGQGIIFDVTADSHITVELVEPDDGPDGPDGPTGAATGRRGPLARRRLRPLAGPGDERRDSPGGTSSGESSGPAGEGAGGTA